MKPLEKQDDQPISMIEIELLNNAAYNDPAVKAICKVLGSYNETLNAAINRINELSAKVEQLEAHSHEYTLGWNNDVHNRTTSAPLLAGEPLRKEPTK